MRRTKIIIIFIFFVFFANTFGREEIRIAVSKASGHVAYSHYGKWLKSIDKDIEIVDLYAMPYLEALKEMGNVSGLILSGGPDVHPGRFGKSSDSSRCEIELDRDTLEFAVYNFALENKIPILGICRGMQLINVAHRGSLVIDLPSDKGTDTLHQNKKPYDSFHNIILDESTLFYSIVKLREGIVNSNHHQGVDKLGANLRASSWSGDGLIESFEWKNQANLPWMLAVQWHPERLENEALSRPIAFEFVRQVKNNQFKKEAK